MGFSTFLGDEGLIERIPFILVSDERWTELQALTGASHIVPSGSRPYDIYQAFAELCPSGEFNFLTYITKGSSYETANKLLLSLENLYANTRNTQMENAPTYNYDYAFDSDDAVYNWSWANCNAYFVDSPQVTTPMTITLPGQFVTYLNSNTGRFQCMITVIPEGMITQQGKLDYTNYIGDKLITVNIVISNPMTPDSTNTNNRLYYSVKGWALNSYLTIQQTAVSSFLGQWIQNNVNISKGTPTPSGDAEETAPGQPDNPISNQGGTGDFSSDAILDQQTGATATTSYAGTTYCLNRAAFRDIKKDLWDADYLTLIKNLFGSGQNTVINCLLFPFNITGITTNPISVNSVFLGTHEVELTSPSAAYALGSGSRAEVTIGPLTGFQKVLGGFLDDNGVTECYIHLPFIGMQQIDPEIIYGHSVSVKYIFDYMTGECQALIYSNMATASDGQTYTNQAVCCYEFSGQAGIPIGFSESNLNSLILNVGVNALKGAFQGGAAGAGTALVEGAMSVIGAPAAHMEGSTGSSIERMKSLDVYLMFIRPKTVIPNTYNKTKGRPSGISAALSTLTGFTVIENPIIQTTATQTEKDIIISKLKEGVRIK